MWINLYNNIRFKGIEFLPQTLIVQSIHHWTSNDLSLKYKRFSPSGCKELSLWKRLKCFYRVGGTESISSLFTYITTKLIFLNHLLHKLYHSFFIFNLDSGHHSSLIQFPVSTVKSDMHDLLWVVWSIKVVLYKSGSTRMLFIYISDKVLLF